MILEGTGLTKSYGPALIVDGIEVSARPGSTLGLLGPNGSGKSTLIGMLAGILAPTGGVVRLEGEELSSLGRRHVARSLAVVAQQVSTDAELSVADVVDLGRIPHRAQWAGVGAEDRRIVAESAARTGVGHLLDRSWHTLSGGEQQRVQIARAFAQQGQVLLLDEPTNHLDIAHQLDVMETVRTSGLTVVVALHDLNLALQYCDEVLLLHEGRAVSSGPPAEVLSTEVIREVYGVAARLVTPAPGEPPLIQFLRPDAVPQPATHG